MDSLAVNAVSGKAALDKYPPGVPNASTRHQPIQVPMFGLIRTVILICVAFVGGLLFERSQAADACAGSGGVIRDGICWNE
ncbi:hypothetical protein [uncultured Tateyamaria sp.]|uniref:hypothetical protein n=1 Tax=uncultured Tateyamaria sp. TaxID=455651 RepID=UPI0026130AB2|nr:hypothetical protein [uncultured Tateyamaria sp.]